MGQKIHPIGFRLGITKNHQSKWFINSLFYSNLVIEDYFIRKKIFTHFSNFGVSEIQIKRKFNDQIKITFNLSKPGILLSKDNNNLEKFGNNLTIQIKNYRKKYFSNILEKASNLTTLYSKNPKIIIQVFELINPDTNVYYLADFLTAQIEKRIAFRRAIKKTLRIAQKAKVAGIKIQIAGRLNGAEIARSEWIREGRIPLQTLQADIYYCYRAARTIFGVLGIKIWIYKKETC